LFGNGAFYGPQDMALDCADPNTNKCNFDDYANNGYSRWSFFEYLTEKYGNAFVQDVLARGAAGAQERDDGRPDPLRLLARVGCGRVPHHRAECMCLRAAPIVRLSWDKISRGDADVEDRVGARDIYRCKEDQRQRQKPHPTYPDGSFDVQKYTGTDSPATQRHAPTRS